MLFFSTSSSSSSLVFASSRWYLLLLVGICFFLMVSQYFYTRTKSIATLLIDSNTVDEVIDRIERILADGPKIGHCGVKDPIHRRFRDGRLLYGTRVILLAVHREDERSGIPLDRKGVVLGRVVDLRLPWLRIAITRWDLQVLTTAAGVVVRMTIGTTHTTIHWCRYRLDNVDLTTTRRAARMERHK